MHHNCHFFYTFVVIFWTGDNKRSDRFHSSTGSGIYDPKWVALSNTVAMVHLTTGNQKINDVDVVVIILVDERKRED